MFKFLILKLTAVNQKAWNVEKCLEGCNITIKSYLKTEKRKDVIPY